MIFHIDGNSFYASCERLFRPDLLLAPIAVLSNNDGIIIALNAECKALGFKRGDVFFENREKLAAAGVAMFSSNYTLYSDISARINLVYHAFAEHVEVYSIDESFLYFDGWDKGDFTVMGQEIRQQVYEQIGVPVSVGIAPTKTLAKMCNKLAKKYGVGANCVGVCEWAKLDQDAALKAYPVGDVWGIGWSKTKFLKSQGVETAYDLKHYPLDKAQKNLTIVGWRTVRELNGIPEIDRAFREKRDQIMCSKSFSQAVFEIDDIIKALQEYTQEAVKRLRADKLVCRYVTVFLMTNPYGTGEQYGNQASAEVEKPTAILTDIARIAISLLKKIYRPGYRYRKTMILLSGLEDSGKVQGGLFDDTALDEKKERCMKAFDVINARYGRNAIRLASANIAPDGVDDVAPWEMKREFLSPDYTTRLSDIPRVS